MIFVKKSSAYFNFSEGTICSNKEIFNDARLARYIYSYSLRNICHVSLNISVMHGEGDIIPMKVSFCGEIHLNVPKTIFIGEEMRPFMVYSLAFLSWIHGFHNGLVRRKCKIQFVNISCKDNNPYWFKV